MKILPYVYKLTHKETGEFYIGVRYGNKYPAELDLGKRYWTSSKVVKPKFNEFNYEILKEFDDSISAINYEKNLIEENWNDPLILNKAIVQSDKWRCTGHTEETKRKMSESKKGKPPNNKGKTLSEETKQKIREKSLQYKHSEESIEKIRLKALGNNRGIGNKSRSGQKQSIEERQKKSQSLKGEKNPNYGKPLPEWQKEAIRAAMLNRPKLKCPHCSKELDPANYKRYHGDKCKLRIDS